MGGSRALTSALGNVLMVFTVILLAGSIYLFAAGIGDDLREPAPQLAETSGEFIAGGERDQQIVQIEHIGGEEVALEDLEIIVEAPDCGTEARLVELPSDGSSLSDSNIEGDSDLIDERSGTTSLADDGIEAFAVGETIEFRVNVEGCDFRESGNSQLEVDIIHTESDAIVTSEQLTA